MRDPYTVLGVPKSADAAEIKKAYRRLAKQFHPDQSRDPKAKERFAEANGAYEIIGDETKRGQFDRGEIDADGKPRFAGFAGAGPGGGAGGFDFNDFAGFAGGSPFGRGGRGGAGFDAGDIFADLLNGGVRGQRRAAGAGGRAATRGSDVATSVSVTLEEVAKGGSVRVALPTGRTLEVRIPVGIEDGKAIRLKGQGQEGVNGAPAGDAMVTVRYAPHRHFHVEGHDLRLDLPVTLYEATLGAKVPVTTLDGTVEISLPAGANRGRTLRLRGKGLPTATGAAGDLLVTPRIALPERIDPELEALARRWRDEAPYDPRGGKA